MRTNKTYHLPSAVVENSGQTINVYRSGYYVECWPESWDDIVAIQKAHREGFARPNESLGCDKKPTGPWLRAWQPVMIAREVVDRGFKKGFPLVCLDSRWSRK